MPRKVPGECVVYLIGNKDDLSLPIKVGRTSERNLKNRLKTLQTGCAFELSVLGFFPGDNVTEKEIHRRLAEWNRHIHGEWFRLTKDIIDYLLDPKCEWYYYHHKKECHCDD